MRVFEVCRIFQPIAQQPVEEDVADPDDRNGLQQWPVQAVPDEKQAERRKQQVPEVINRRAHSRIAR